MSSIKTQYSIQRLGCSLYYSLSVGLYIIQLYWTDTYQDAIRLFLMDNQCRGPFWGRITASIVGHQIRYQPNSDKSFRHLVLTFSSVCCNHPSLYTAIVGSHQGAIRPIKGCVSANPNHRFKIRPTRAFLPFFLGKK